MTFAAPPIQLSQLLKTVPAEWVHPQLPAVIKDREIDGIVEIVSATVTGSSVAGPQLSLTGEFRVKQGQALIGESRVPAKDLTAVVSVEAGRLRVSNLSGLYGTIHMSESKALVSFLEAGPWLEMDMIGTMTAADLLQFLAKTVKSEQLSRVLAASREVEGDAAPTFRMVGPLNQPGGITFAGGEITVQACQSDQSVIAGAVDGAAGPVRVVGRRDHVRSSDGTLGRSGLTDQWGHHGGQWQCVSGFSDSGQGRCGPYGQVAALESHSSRASRVGQRRRGLNRADPLAAYTR